MTLVLENIQIPLPTGATIPLCSPLPIMVLVIMTDHRLGFISGWVCGILAMLLIPVWQVVHWGQFFVEHMICFSCIGYISIFGADKRWKILCGLLLASFLKICGHLMSGVVFFSQNAWDGWGAWGYSLVYNLSQNVPLCVVCGIIVMALPLKTLRKAASGR
jgi:thiamine transporter